MAGLSSLMLRQCLTGCLSATIILVAGMARAKEINLSCDLDYKIIDGKFVDDSKPERIYIKYKSTSLNSVSIPESISIDASCDKSKSAVKQIGDTLQVFCKWKNIFLTEVDIHRHTGEFMRHTQNLISKSLRYVETAGTCHRARDLF